MIDTKIPVIVFATLIFGGLLISGSAVTAQETNSTVDVGVGNSLNVVIEEIDNDVEGDISNITRDNNNTSLNEDLEENRNRLSEIRDEYNETIKEYKNGNISREDLATKIAILNSRSDQVKNQLEDIKRSTDNETVKKEANVSKNEAGFVGSQSAKMVKNGVINSTSNMSMNASNNGISVAIEASNGRVMRGLDMRQPNHGQFNITEDEAVQSAIDKLNITVNNTEVTSNNTSDTGEYNITTKKVNAGFYLVKFKNSNESITAKIDGKDGSIWSMNEVSKRNNMNRPPVELPRGVPDDRGKPPVEKPPVDKPDVGSDNPNSNRSDGKPEQNNPSNKSNSKSDTPGRPNR